MGRGGEGVKNRQLDSFPRSMLEANAWRAVKHAGHHEEGGDMNGWVDAPTYSCYCVRYCRTCRIQDLLLLLSTEPRRDAQEGEKARTFLFTLE
jgi:hypothetical protein